VNLAELDEDARAALDAPPPPWPLPPWLVAQTERMRYPTLWEAVMTHWTPSGAHDHELSDTLLVHVNDVLRNRYASQRGWRGRLGDAPAPDVTPAGVERGVPITVDGAELTGIRVDTDPFVRGIAADLPDGRRLTAVLPRDALPLVRAEFVTTPPP